MKITLTFKDGAVYTYPAWWMITYLVVFFLFLWFMGWWSR